MSGPALSVVPKTGGNTVKGSVYLAGVSERDGRQQLHRPNCRHAGLGTPGRLLKLWDFTGGHGRTDQEGSALVLPEPAQSGIALIGAGMFANRNAGDAYEMDL